MRQGRNQAVMIVSIIWMVLSLTGAKAYAQANAKEAPPAQKKEAPEWLELEGRLTELGAKIEAKKINIRSLIEEKNHLPEGSPRLSPLIKELVTEHKELKKLAEDYEKKRANFYYRFPERNSQGERQYEKKEILPLDELERVLSVNDKIDQSFKIFEKQYRPKKKVVVDPSTPSETTPEAEPNGNNKSIDEQKRILLKK